MPGYAPCVSGPSTLEKPDAKPLETPLGACRTWSGTDRPGGLHAWLPLSTKIDLYRIIQTAQEQGLGVANAEAFSQADTPPSGIRISLGGAPDARGLQTALEKLTVILRDQQTPRAPQAIV